MILYPSGSIPNLLRSLSHREQLGDLKYRCGNEEVGESDRTTTDQKQNFSPVKIIDKKNCSKGGKECHVKKKSRGIKSQIRGRRPANPPRHDISWQFIIQKVFYPIWCLKPRHILSPTYSLRPMTFCFHYINSDYSADRDRTIWISSASAPPQLTILTRCQLEELPLVLLSRLLQTFFYLFCCLSCLEHTAFACIHIQTWSGGNLAYGRFLSDCCLFCVKAV